MENNPSLAQLAEATVLSSVKSEFESLRRDHPIYKSPIWKVYGPYLNYKDKRLRVVAYDGDKRTTISYPKFIMECKYRRILRLNEDVHHKDDNIENNLIDNFQIINESEHKSNHRSSDIRSIKHGTRKMLRELGCRCHECRMFARKWGH